MPTEIPLPDGFDDPDDAAEALREYGNHDDPVVLERDDYEALEQNIDELSSVFREALQERTDLSDEVVDDLSIDALTAEFRDDDGDIQVDALTQEPETQEPDPTDTPTADVDPDALETPITFDDPAEAVDALQERRNQLQEMGWDGKPMDRVEADLETLGVEVN